MKIRIILICVLFVIASLLGIFAQDLGFNVAVFEWSTYLSWFFYVMMVVMIIMSIAMEDTKDYRVKILFIVVIPLGILVSMWSLFVIAMSL